VFKTASSDKKETEKKIHKAKITSIVSLPSVIEPDCSSFISSSTTWGFKNRHVGLSLTTWWLELLRPIASQAEFCL
jgi:hypothetical protein